MAGLRALATVAIPEIKEAILRSNIQDLIELSELALGLTTAVEVEQLLERRLAVDAAAGGREHHLADAVGTGRLEDVMNTYFQNEGLSFSVAAHEWIMPIPLREIDIDPDLEQNPGY